MHKRAMGQVDSVVFVMLDDRSLDDALGHCYGADERPAHVYPPNSSPHFDGLAGKTPSPTDNLNLLARRFAVSDAWFSSVPSEGTPNRAFSLCGEGGDAGEQVDMPTIFNVLRAVGKTCGLYTADVWKDGRSFTEYTFPQIGALKDLHRASLDDFLAEAKKGDLPAFSYVEPAWGSEAAAGDDFVGQVVAAVRSNPKAWAHTLVVITFAAGGGTPDHVGARVPTILVSPLVKSGTVFRAPPGKHFDHTSFIKTLLLWAGINPDTVKLGKRMPQAPTFDAVIGETVVNDAPLAAHRS